MWINLQQRNFKFKIKTGCTTPRSATDCQDQERETNNKIVVFEIKIKLLDTKTMVSRPHPWLQFDTYNIPRHFRPFNFVSREVNQTRGNKFKIFQDHVHYNLRKYYFSNRVIQIWNSLPDSVVESKSINSFKNNLDKFWQNEDVKFNWKANLTAAGSRSLSLM